MDAKFRCSNPDEMEFELSVRMTLGRWKQLREQLEKAKYPARDFHSQIHDMVRQAEKVYAPEKTKKKKG